jgi:ATP-dependent helicase/nuclease subunit B
MTAIEQNNQTPPAPLPVWSTLWAQVRTHMQALGAHPARTVVLLPFFQLQAVASQQAAQAWPQGFTPRCETTKSWSQRIGHFMPGALDISWDAGLDSLRAKDWLQRAGLAAQQGMLASGLVQAAHQLGTLVAAVPPAQRAAWAAAARSQALQGLDKLGSNPLMYEAAVARIALEWAVASRYATDVLFDDAVQRSLDALIVLPGLQANPLAQALVQHWSAMSTTAVLDDATTNAFNMDAVGLHECTNAHDEADRASACVLRHIESGNLPIALAAVDRVATRRISATLQLHGVQVLDETGWKLSTTRAAASIMALLRAARGRMGATANQADGADDALLDWLKHTNAARSRVDALEKLFRAQNTSVVHVSTAQAAIEFIVNDVTEDSMQGNTQDSGKDPVQAVANIDTVLHSLHERRRPAQWLHALHTALHSTGQWAALNTDEAGRDCLQALHLLDPDALADHAQAMSLAEFTSWATDCLENASFKPSAAAASAAQVVVLPLAQVLARPFAAIVIAGADEARLPASPEPQGNWSSAQRAALGLPSRTQLAAEQQRVWACAMGLPRVDVLWRSAEGEQTLLPSPLLQNWLQKTAMGKSQKDDAPHYALHYSPDPRIQVAVTPTPTLPPLPVAGSLRISTLSASAYSDLRTCPYRYFALRLLGLHDAPELDAEIDKRDFGSWLHSVLSDFHTQRKALNAANTPQSDQQLLDHCAAQRHMHDAGFIPFAAAWPQVRDSYLAWLAKHEAEGWQFDQAELERTRQHGSVQLVGRLDRVDVLGRGPLAGTPYVMDYKTESDTASKAKTRIAAEDTQLAFYAALMGSDGTDDDLHAAYINLAERTCKTTPQTNVLAARDAVLQGISVDVQRIHTGHTMPALGEGSACEYCAARGLCRKDMWTL